MNDFIQTFHFRGLGTVLSLNMINLRKVFTRMLFLLEMT